MGAAAGAGVVETGAADVAAGKIRSIEVGTPGDVGAAEVNPIPKSTTTERATLPGTEPAPPGAAQPASSRAVVTKTAGDRTARGWPTKAGIPMTTGRSLPDFRCTRTLSSSAISGQTVPLNARTDTPGSFDAADRWAAPTCAQLVAARPALSAHTGLVGCVGSPSGPVSGVQKKEMTGLAPRSERA